MKIIELRAENIKKIRVIEIRPTGHVVQVTGRNGSGKTSVLDSIFWALTGTKHIQSMPIRKGATSARVTLDMGEIVVTRRFTEKDSTLIVENAEGARYRSPQRMLDDLIGALSFDPLAFSRMEPKEQFEELKRLVPLEIDVDQLDGLNRADFADRTDVNRQAKAARAQADGIVVPADLPEMSIDAKPILDRLAAVGTVNAAIDGEQQRRVGLAALAAKRRATAQECRDQAARHRATAEQLETDAITHSEEAEGLDLALREAAPIGDKVDAGAIRLELDAAEKIKAGIERRLRKAAFVADAEKLEKQSDDLTETMAARAKAKETAIAAAKMPVDGLAFGDGIILYNGIPFDQASSAEQLRVSTAIAMAGNPKLRVLRIKEGSLLDQNGLSLITKMATDGDYQCWIESVSETGKVGIVLEDGSVIADNQSAAEQSALALEA